jgi:hypothetical protein
MIKTHVPPTWHKLNVTTEPDGRGGKLWVAYEVCKVMGVNYAFRLATADNLDDLRYFGEREGYNDLLIGTPSVKWAAITVLN